MKKKTSNKSIGAGISLEPDLIEKARKLAQRRGFNGLSPFVRVLLHDEINRHEYMLERDRLGNAPTPDNVIIAAQQSATCAGGSSIPPDAKCRKVGKLK